MPTSGLTPSLRRTLSAGPNYAIQFTSGTLTVSTADLTITADDATKTYGAAARLRRIVFGTGQRRLQHRGGRTSLSTTATAASNAGNYAIVPGGATATNYAISYVNGTLDVNPAVLFVTADDLSNTYGTALPALTYSDTGLVNGDSATVFSGDLATTATAASNVGNYPIFQGSLSAGDNYAIAFHSGVLSVNPAPLTITANNTTMTYGAALPALNLLRRGTGQRRLRHRLLGRTGYLGIAIKQRGRIHHHPGHALRRLELLDHLH